VADFHLLLKHFPDILPMNCTTLKFCNLPN
jgi:hypothetical protein